MHIYHDYWCRYDRCWYSYSHICLSLYDTVHSNFLIKQTNMFLCPLLGNISQWHIYEDHQLTYATMDRSYLFLWIIFILASEKLSDAAMLEALISTLFRSWGDTEQWNMMVNVLSYDPYSIEISTLSQYYITLMLHYIDATCSHLWCFWYAQQYRRWYRGLKSVIWASVCN